MKKYARRRIKQIKYSTNNELVFRIVGTSAPSFYDNATIVANGGKDIVLYIWYDNEYGYSHQVIRLAKYTKIKTFYITTSIAFRLALVIIF
jgi:glyceraldehyde 3-phosphate dehydrogenase